MKVAGRRAMQEGVSAVAGENGMLLLIASAVITLCVAAVLSAVAMNFLGIQGSHGKVQREKRSPVATLSMLVFFFCFYLLIHYRIYTLAIDPGAVRTSMIIVGTTLVVIGAAVNIMGRFSLGRNWANQVTVYESQYLVSTGVFAFVRHPLYASLLWMFTGASIVYLNLPALAITYLIFLPMVYFRARQEEAMLIVSLDGYSEYMRRVGMFWPRISIKGGTIDEIGNG